MSQLQDDSYVEEASRNVEVTIAQQISDLRKIGMIVNQDETKVMVFCFRGPTTEILIEGTIIKLQIKSSPLESNWTVNRSGIYIEYLRTRILPLISGTLQQSITIITAQIRSILFYRVSITSNFHVMCEMRF